MKRCSQWLPASHSWELIFLSKILLGLGMHISKICRDNSIPGKLERLKSLGNATHFGLISYQHICFIPLWFVIRKSLRMKQKEASIQDGHTPCTLVVQIRCLRIEEDHTNFKRIEKNIQSIWHHLQLLDVYYGSLIYSPLFLGKFGVQSTGK